MAPSIGAGPWRRVSHGDGGTVSWAVPVSDASGVLRVLVVYTTGQVDALGRGRWEPLELTDDGHGRGGEPCAAWRDGVVNVIQAWDKRGNVGWVRFSHVAGSVLVVALPKATAMVTGAGPTVVAVCSQFKR